MKEFVKRIPLLGDFILKTYRILKGKKKFAGSRRYWESRYVSGGDSGAGSYGRLAEFKAEILNRFVEDNDIKTVIELGCGDGHQLTLANYPNYLGIDVSATALNLCKKQFGLDQTKSFFLYKPGHGVEIANKYDLALSLDVIYHLVEDKIFEFYMRDLFSVAGRFVVIYSSNFDSFQKHHERTRKFTDWIENQIDGWSLVTEIPNRYPYNETDPENTSQSNFFIYRKN